MSTVGRVLGDVIGVYLLVLFARFVLDWVVQLNRSFRPKGAMVVVFDIVYTLTDPPLRLLRRLIPPLRIGSVSLDLGFLVLFIGLVAIKSAASSL